MPLASQDRAAHLSQQGLQPPPEGSVLPAELLVVSQHGLQPSLQPLQILFLLPPGLAGRLPVLDHSLLPLQQLCLGYREGQMGRRGELCFPTPLFTLATLLPSSPLPTQPEGGCSSLLKHLQKEPFSQPLHAPGPQELREVRLQEELPPS